MKEEWAGIIYTLMGKETGVCLGGGVWFSALGVTNVSIAHTEPSSETVAEPLADGSGSGDEGETNLAVRVTLPLILLLLLAAAAVAVAVYIARRRHGRERYKCITTLTLHRACIIIHFCCMKPTT